MGSQKESRLIPGTGTGGDKTRMRCMEPENPTVTFGLSPEIPK